MEGESGKKLIASKLKEQQVPLIESQLYGHSPARQSHSPFKSRLKSANTHTKSKNEG